MASYIFNPTTTEAFVDWGDGSIWAGGVVPDAADADVVFPIIYLGSSLYNYYFQIAGAESFSVRSMALDDYLLVYGGLNVSGELTEAAGAEIDLSGGTLAVGGLVNDGFDIQGSGALRSTGLLTNNTEIVGDGLTVRVAALSDPGSLIAASGDLTVDVEPGGFADLSGSTLSGESYTAGGQPTVASVLYLDVGAVVTDIAADVSLGLGGDIQSLDPSTGAFTSFLSTVDLISAAGTLSIRGQAFAWGALSVEGVIAMQGGTLDSTDLQVAPGGEIAGYGTIGSPLDDAGTIIAEIVPAPIAGSPTSATLTLDGAVAGSGALEIAAGIPTLAGPGERGGSGGAAATLELGAAASQEVTFANDIGTLTLDDPGDFSGVVQTSGWGDQVVLGGISLAAITGYAFLASGDGGTLTLNEGDESLSLNFLGELTTANFALAAVAPTLSTLPPSVIVTVVAAPAGDYVASAAALAGLTAGQIAALAGQGVTALVASDAGVTYDSAQSAAIVAAGIAARAPAGDLAVENFADGSGKSFAFGADGQLAKVVTHEADGAFDVYFFGPAGNISGADYVDYDVVYAAGGIRDEKIYYDAAGDVAATQDFAADGGYSLEVDGAMMRLKTVQTNGDFDVEHFGVSGNVGGVDYANIDVGFAAAGRRTYLIYEDASGAPVAERTFSANGGYALEVGGDLVRQATIASDGDSQIAVFGDSGADPASFQNDFDAAGRQVAHSADDDDGSGAVKIFGSGLWVTSSGRIGPTDGAADFTFTPHAVEIYTLFAGATGDTIQFDPGFGASTVRGFATATGDVVDVSDLFANFAAAMESTTLSAGGATITDGFHDQLTLAGVTASSLTPAALGFG